MNVCVTFNVASRLRRIASPLRCWQERDTSEAFAGYIARHQNDAGGKWSALQSRDERVLKIRSAIQQLPHNELLHVQDELRRLLPARKFR